MSSTPIVIGLVQFTRGLNLTRQRFKGRKSQGGSVGLTIRQQPAESSDWQIFPYAAGLLQAQTARFEQIDPLLPAAPAPPDGDVLTAAERALDGRGPAVAVLAR